jgi:glutamate-5-semialdehyde dehydrogenase
MTAEAREQDTLAATMHALGVRARRAFATLAHSTAAQRAGALEAGADELARRQADVLDANARDVAEATERGLSPAMLDRLRLDPARVAAMCEGLVVVAQMPDPLGRVLAEWERPNGLRIQRVSVPLGVIGIIYA